MLSKPLFFLALLGVQLLCGSSIPIAQSQPYIAEKINLALRRTGDQLLRLSGDSTSRIPAVTQAKPNVFQIHLDQSFEYDSLPAVLQSALDQFNIELSYAVAIRRCGDHVIDLGFQKQDFVSDSLVPCVGREYPEGCHYIEVIFLENVERNSSLATTGIFLMLGLLAGAGALWTFKRKPIASADLPESEWLSFGNSRLHVASQMLDCAGKNHQLTYRETKLLALFVRNANRLMERDYIIEQVWTDEGVQISRSIDTFVSRLRKKLVDDPAVTLVAVHGVGYKMDVR